MVVGAGAGGVDPDPSAEDPSEDPIAEGDDELSDEDAEASWREVEELKGLLQESQNELVAKSHELAKSETKRETLERLLDERSAEVEDQIEQKKRLGDDIANYLRAAGARRGRSSAEVKLLQSELRAARAKARALAEDATELQLRYQRKSSESQEHSSKRVWLEKRLSKNSVRVNALEDGLSQFQELHKAQVEKKQQIATTLGRTKLRLAETEMAGDLLQAKLVAAQEKSDVIARQMAKLHAEVEKGGTDLSGLGPGQDKRVTDLRERLKVAHDAKMRAGRAQEDLDVQTDAAFRAKAQEHTEELKRMMNAVKEAETAMLTEDAEAPDPADDLLRQAEERKSPVQEEEEDPEDLREELRAGIREVDMQRQLLGWAGVALDEDANYLLAPGKRSEDIAQRAVGSLLMWASLTPIGTVGDEQVQTLADTGMVLAFSNVRTGKEPLKHFSPHLKGLPRLYAELEELTVHGYHTPEERKRRAKATATFQAMLRVKRALKAFRKRQREKLEHESATVINSHSRGHLGRNKAREHRHVRKEEHRQLKRQRDLAHAEAMMEQALGTDDEDDDGDVYEHANIKLKKANRSYRHMIRGLPVAAVAHLSANKKHGPLYAILMQAVMGSKDYQRRLKKYKKLRNNGNVAGGWAALDDDDDSVSAQAVLRERIWQLEGDVSALLLVDARRRLADRRQTLIDSNKGKSIAPHQAYAQEKDKSRSLADIGQRPKPQPWLTSPEPTYRPQTTDAAFRPATSGSMGSNQPPLTPGSLEYQEDGSLASASPREEGSLAGWSQQDDTDPLMSPYTNANGEVVEGREQMEAQARPVSRAISHIGCSPTLTQRLRVAQSSRRATSGYRNATRNGPNALDHVGVRDSLPVLEAAVQEAAAAAGVSVSPRHSDKTMGGQTAVGGKAAVQWQEWLRKEKGLKLELTPIATSGLAHTLQGPYKLDDAVAAAAQFASMDLQGSKTGRKVLRKKTEVRKPLDKQRHTHSRPAVRVESEDYRDEDEDEDADGIADGVGAW